MLAVPLPHFLLSVQKEKMWVRELLQEPQVPESLRDSPHRIDAFVYCLPRGDGEGHCRHNPEIRESEDGGAHIHRGYHPLWHRQLLLGGAHLQAGNLELHLHQVHDYQSVQQPRTQAEAGNQARDLRVILDNLLVRRIYSCGYGG